MRWFVALIALGLAVLVTAGARAKPEKRLRACVLEHVDRWSKSEGAAQELKAAGFEVSPLSLKRSPRGLRADLIVLGSFSSELPAYADYMDRYREDLVRFVTRGGVLLQFTQADQTEAAPPFLPTGLQAYRADPDHESIWLLEPAHPLLTDVPRTSAQPPRLDIPPSGWPPTSWETLSYQEGFRPLLAATKDGGSPVLLEAAVGKGRILLSSLFLDKVQGAEGVPPRTSMFLEASYAFFHNLERYVRLVAEGNAPDVVVPTPARAPPTRPVEAAPAPPLAWDLAPSDLAHYTVTTLSCHGLATELFVFGHDLRSDGQFEPHLPLLQDLADILAFRLPRGGAASERIECRCENRTCGPLRVRGRVEAWAAGDGRAGFRGTYRFESVHRRSIHAPKKVEGGTATVDGLFDLREQVVKRSRVRIGWLERPRTKASEDPPQRVAALREYRLRHVRETRYVGFRNDVGAAIDRGIAYLKGRQEASGGYPAYRDADWRTGTTALVALTLAACDVPADDPVLASAFSWLLRQTPERTYARAVGLMAVDRGRPPGFGPWAERTAAALAAHVSAHGWDYGTFGPVDLSNTQYAVLGLRAAERMGIPVEEEVWRDVVRCIARMRVGGEGKHRLLLTYDEEGEAGAATRSVAERTVPDAAGFAYRLTAKGMRPRASMTCGAISSLVIAREALRKRQALPRALAGEIDRMILGGWAWLDRHWESDRLPHSGRVQSPFYWFYYYLYALERAGILDAVREVGQRDWYFEGATVLLALQDDDGSWKDRRTVGIGDSRLVDTCFALLFLKRATPPITPSER